MTTYVAIKRCCGASRTQNGLYAECGLSPFGRPLEEFLVDYPFVMQDDLVPYIGQVILPFSNSDGSTTYHLFDHIGSDHYPNLADFIEEVRVGGVSRKISEHLDLSLLDPNRSRMFLLHSRAIIENHDDYGAWRCPKHIETHAFDHPQRLHGSVQSCLGLAWEDVDGGLTVDGRNVLRTIPATEYEARKRPAGVTPIYRRAIFASFPITRFAVVKGAESHEKYQRVKSKAKLFNVEEVEE